ncbi:hypothetical protein [Ectobacillus ponti]|uniref:Uncharacterized protein n=1 Tax=Ectobacillus ponti TaxID=2961894 RepID=A0AA42BSY2_9BACI|nr:hypothetical protein [Ectobacillus ponti]MCP8968923.1 hypothetical protein [Ectobacillus ponti]
MNKSFAAVGIFSIVLAALLILLCPDEQDFVKYIEQKQDISCSGTSLVCEQNGVKMTLAETHIRKGVFFMTGERTFEYEGHRLKVWSFGMLGTFFGTRVTETT